MEAKDRRHPSNSSCYPSPSKERSQRPCPCGTNLPPPFVRTPNGDVQWDMKFREWSGWNWVKRDSHTEQRQVGSTSVHRNYSEPSQEIVRSCTLCPQYSSSVRNPPAPPQRRPKNSNAFKSFCQMCQCISKTDKEIRKLSSREKLHLQSRYSTPCASVVDPCELALKFDRNVPNCFAHRSDDRHKSSNKANSRWSKERSQTTTCSEDLQKSSHHRSEDCGHHCRRSKYEIEPAKRQEVVACKRSDNSRRKCCLCKYDELPNRSEEMSKPCSYRNAGVQHSEKSDSFLYVGRKSSHSCCCKCKRSNHRNSCCLVLCPKILEGVVMVDKTNCSYASSCSCCCKERQKVEVEVGTSQMELDSCSCVERGVSARCLGVESSVQTLDMMEQKRHHHGCCCCCKNREATNKAPRICMGQVVPIVCCRGEEVLAKQINYILKMKSSLDNNASSLDSTQNGLQ